MASKACKLQFVGTAILLFFITMIVDIRNRIPSYLHPTLFGFILIAIGNSLGMNGVRLQSKIGSKMRSLFQGYEINSNRDAGPRLFLFTIGYGFEVFSHHNFASLIFVVAPLVRRRMRAVE